MQLAKIEIPEEYKNKTSSFVKGATGPGFICAFSYNFSAPMSVSAVIEFLERKSLASKGVSIYINEEHVWLNFVFRQFNSVTKIAPEAEIKIEGVRIDPYEIDFEKTNFEDQSTIVLKKNTPKE